MASLSTSKDDSTLDAEGESMPKGDKVEAFPRISTTETPELDYISTSESDYPQISLSKRGGSGRTMSKAKAKRARKEHQRSTSGQQASSSSLRPAQDVMNRIRHDPELKVSEYVVGYKDRHVGIMEKAVENWSVEGVEEEEFIPLHRIEYFRRTTDDHIVWHREQRIDEIFRSGVSGEI
ncbi:MAG: hypothetical protein Q9201_000091 [Fulgogasparrea decipioides]